MEVNEQLVKLTDQSVVMLIGETVLDSTRYPNFSITFVQVGM